MLLVDKYSPQKLQDILGNKEVLSILSRIKSDFPHLFFTGPPGTGKTTVAHIIKTDFECLELNASDERGIDTIRTSLKDFCNKQGDNKLVVLDECDHLTTAAQQALRRIMETSSTKFILICNQMSQVIEPIQSRCAVLKFEKISKTEFVDKIKDICSEEHIDLTESGLEALVNISAGDFRACLNCLQPLLNLQMPIDDDFLYKLNGIPSFKILESIMEQIKLKNFESSIKMFNDLWKIKFESTDLLEGFFKVAKSWDNYEILKIIGKYHLKANEGVNSKMQFYSMFHEINKILN